MDFKGKFDGDGRKGLRIRTALFWIICKGVTLLLKVLKKKTIDA